MNYKAPSPIVEQVSGVSNDAAMWVFLGYCMALVESQMHNFGDHESKEYARLKIMLMEPRFSVEMAPRGAEK